jgi:hypothetical protein
MRNRSGSFIDGVILAAQQVSNRQSNVLIKDRRDVMTYCSTLGALAGGGKPMPTMFHVADAWLKYRLAQPSGELNLDALREATNDPRNTPIIQQAEKAFDTIADHAFVCLFAGAQIGLQHFAPDIDAGLLKADWASVPEIYRNLLTVYKANGVSEDGTRMLAIREILDRRMSYWDAAMSWSRVFGGRELRFGCLDVVTTPSDAAVSVDQEAWGRSRVKNAIARGEHHVSAEREFFKGDLNVTIEAAEEKLVELTLAQR